MAEAESSAPRNIFLVGYRGTGKTTVAALLAEQLGWQWLDADAALEARHGRTIRRIFAEDGEGGFRLLESQVLADLCRLSQHVIATGGGVVLNPANRAALRAAGKVVWLTADAATLAERLQQDPNSRERRPVLTVGGCAEIEQLLQQREPHYRACADWMVATGGRSPVEVVQAILPLLKGERAS